jgi:antibiotic biosynthesis monooxygenase (ABM) superfamily enzyme
VKHEGKALAADETDAHHHRSPAVASVHVRAVLTWCAIFPLVALGMTVQGRFAASWPPILRALSLTLVVVPLAVYVVVPRFLRLYSRVQGTARAASRRRRERRAARFSR